MKKPLTNQEARAELLRQGISMAQWAREHDFSYSLVSEVLAGHKKCTFGASHNIAIALGMKLGVPTTRPGRGVHASNQAQAKAAA